MKIVITDGYTLNPGDLSWKAFDALGEVMYYDRTPAALVAERCKEAEIIITNKTPINAATISAAIDLKAIAVTATGYNIVDSEAAKARNIPVCNVPVYGTDSVAQHAFALLLELTNQVGKNSESVRQGDWSASIDWCYTRSPIMELSKKIFGIIGYGRIGKQTGKIAEVFGMEVIYYNRSTQEGTPGSVTLETLFAESDCISIHCPLTPDNHGFINKKLFSLMKPTAFLINTSRGQLINEQDLAEALKSGQFAGAALDVLSVEPPPLNHPLIGLPECIITPHTAWISYEARQRLMQVTFENVVSIIKGTPRNVVNAI
ncbi:MAG: D-2-hydroxyacid dehydrogenase [Bacteroidetes bacterium]|nr:D-2-hydroxyacid dehydrogenase [Bacteroidota bacterium]